MMKFLLHPSSLISAGIAVAGVVFSSVPFVLIGGILWIGSVAVAASKQAQNRGGAPHPSEQNPESRLLMRPLNQLHSQLEEVVRQNSDMTSVKIVGGEALMESRNIVEQASRMVEIRAQIKRTLRSKGEAEIKLAQLQQQMAAVVSEGERNSLQQAISATTREIEQYSALQNSVDGIDSRLREAEASLSEIKARIAVGAAGARAESGADSDLQELVGRLRTLGTSFQEAEATLEQNIR